MTRHSFVRPGERHAGRSGAADDRLHERELVGGRGPEEVVVAALGGLQHVSPVQDRPAAPVGDHGKDRVAGREHVGRDVRGQFAGPAAPA